jgi:hypothetical protein
VNIIAEGYLTYLYYDYILKTDLDVFITKQFANYLPVTYKTLLVGQGGYSTEFNTRRLGRIARDMGWSYQNLTSIGSTWLVGNHLDIYAQAGREKINAERLICVRCRRREFIINSIREKICFIICFCEYESLLKRLVLVIDK